MLWKELMRRLNTAFERHPEHLNDVAKVRTGDVLYELDLFRSLSSGRLHLGPAYPTSPEDDEEEVFEERRRAAAPSITPPEQPVEQREEETEEAEEAQEAYDIKPTSFSKAPKHE